MPDREVLQFSSLFPSSKAVYSEGHDIRAAWLAGFVAGSQTLREHN